MIDLILKEMLVPFIGMIIASLGTWLTVNWVNKRKSNAEAEKIEVSNDSVTIANLEKAVQVYCKMLDAERENSKIQAENQEKQMAAMMVTVNDTNDKVQHLTSVVENLADVSCLDNRCSNRKMLTLSQSRALIAGNKIDLKYETSFKKNI